MRRMAVRMWPVWLAVCVSSGIGHEAAAQTTDTIALRGHAQSLRLYGTRGGATGDRVQWRWRMDPPRRRTWPKLLAARGFFVVGFDAKAYLESFTSARSTLRPEDEPADYKVLADYAGRGATQRPILIGVSEGAGLSVLAATDPRTRGCDRRRHRPGAAQPQRAGLALEGQPDLSDARRARRADVQRRGHRRAREPGADGGHPLHARRVRPAHRSPAACSTRRKEPKRLWIVDGVRPSVQRQPDRVRSRLLEAVEWMRDHAAP